MFFGLCSLCQPGSHQSEWDCIPLNSLVTDSSQEGSVLRAGYGHFHKHTNSLYLKCRLLHSIKLSRVQSTSAGKSTWLRWSRFGTGIRPDLWMEDCWDIPRLQPRLGSKKKIPKEDTIIIMHVSIKITQRFYCCLC